MPTPSVRNAVVNLIIVDILLRGQLGEGCRYRPRLILAEHLGCPGSTSGLIEINARRDLGPTE